VMQADLSIERPVDRVPDWQAGAAACAATGMSGLAGRLEQRS